MQAVNTRRFAAPPFGQTINWRFCLYLQALPQQPHGAARRSLSGCYCTAMLVQSVRKRYASIQDLRQADDHRLLPLDARRSGSRVGVARHNVVARR